MTDTGGTTAIEVTYKPNVYDYRRVLWWHRRKRIIIILGLAVLVSAFLVYPILSGTATGVPGVILFFLMAMPLLVALILYGGLMRQANSIVDVFDEAKVVFDKEGLSSASGPESGGMKWEEFHKVYETEQDFIFFPEAKIFYTVPKRFFDNEGSITKLRDLLTEKLESKFHKSY